MGLVIPLLVLVACICFVVIIVLVAVQKKPIDKLY